MFQYYWPATYRRVMGRGEVPAAFTDQGAFLQNTLKAIFNEREAQSLYRLLYDRADTPFQKRQIKHALDDEIKHERMLTEIYQILTGQSPQVPLPADVELADFQNGVRQAFEDELEAAELYRSMYVSTSLPWLRDKMLEIMTDEMEHGTRFTYLRAEL